MTVIETWDGYSLLRVTRSDADFYVLLGPFFGSRRAAKELGMPIYDDDHRVWIVVLSRSKPVACGSIEIKGHKAALKSAWVMPDHRGRGIYGRMVEQRLRLAEDAGVTVITSTTTKASLPALLRRGFKQVGMRGKYSLLRKEFTHEH